jgi:enterochelin esterase family protein
MKFLSPFTSIAAMALATTLLTAQSPAPARPTPPPVRSPDVSADRMVTFRLRAPDAKRVTVVVSEIMRQAPGYDPTWATGTFNDDEVQMKKGADGVWSLTVGPVLPDKYDYVFNVDGVRTLDPVNLDLKPGDAAVENWLTVRGTEPLYSDNREVPHGTVATVAYHSKTLGLNRFLNVYTPPGYETSTARYPVLYLLHGAGNRYDTWASADAGFIFDNLLEKKAMTPMIVVMPNGHVAPGAKQVPANTPAGAFGADFLNDIMPLVEARYRIRSDRNSRAIVGLSMGAGHTAAIGFARLDLFNHIGLMSGVGLDREGKLPAYIPDAATVNGKLKLFWIGRGKTENIAGARAFSQALQGKGIRHVLHESDFGHSWITWRRDLYYEVAPKLFR